MKKSLLLSALAIAVGAQFAASITPQYQWGKVFQADPNKQTTISNVVSAPEGSYYLTSHINPGKPTKLTFGANDEVTVPDITSTFQQTPCLMRMNADGSRAWTLIPTFANQNTDVVLATADNGDMIYAAMFTFNKDGAGAPTLLDLKDVAQNNIHIEWAGTPESKSPYACIVMRINLDGVVKWAKLLTPEVSATQLSPMALKGIACLDNKIYLAGSLKSSLSADGTVVIEKESNTTAEGFILALNADGSYSHSSIASSEGIGSQFDAIALGGDKIYGALTVSAKGQVNFGGLRYVCPAAASVAVVEINPEDFNATKLIALNATGASDDKHTTQIKGLQVVGENYYIYGSVKGGFENTTKLVESAGIPLEGFAICGNTADKMTPVSGIIQGTSISGYLGMLVNEDATKAWFYGYQMTNGGMYLREVALDGANMTIGETTYLTKGGMQSMGLCHFDNATKQLIAVSRNNAATTILETSVELPKPGGFSAIISSFKVEDLSTMQASAEIAGADAQAPVEFFNLQGIRVDNPADGIFIRRQGAHVSKVIVR